MFDFFKNLFTSYKSNRSQSAEDTDQVNDALNKIKDERISKCNHGIKFDSNIAAKMNVYEVRKIFPRLCGICPKGCGYNGIYYASYEHYISGDW